MRLPKDWRGEPPYLWLAWPIFIYGMVTGIGWLMRHFGLTGP